MYFRPLLPSSNPDILEGNLIGLSIESLVASGDRTCIYLQRHRANQLQKLSEHALLHYPVRAPEQVGAGIQSIAVTGTSNLTRHRLMRGINSPMCSSVGTSSNSQNPFLP